MRNFFFIKLILLLVLISSCETVQKKSDEAVKKENEKLSKFIGQPESELKIVMGNPDEETKNAIACEREFEINEVNMVVGFTSKGCF